MDHRRRKVLFSVIATVAFALVLGGCARLNSIHRSYRADRPGSANVVTVDAKQRHLLIAPERDAEKSNRFRICAEAAPDVFSAYASSLGMNLGWGATDRNAKLANAMAESAATVERTQTINLLRESMYRTCERYLSGALDQDQFIIQASRDQRSMVAVLAIEQLTGAVRAKPTIISGPATSASIIDGTEAAKLIERFRTEEQAARENVATAEKDYASAKKTGKCDTIAEKPAADAKDPTADEWTACKAAEALLAQRNKELEAATGRLDKALTLAADFVVKSNASTSAGTNDSAAYTATKPGDAALKAVAQAVENIVTEGIDEPLMFCIAYLQRIGPVKSRVVDACAEIISERGRYVLQRRRIQAGLVDAAGYRRSVDQGERLNDFVQRLHAQIDATDPALLSKKITAFESRAGAKFDLGPACTSADACKDAVDDSNLNRFYRANEARLEAALDDWEKL